MDEGRKAALLSILRWLDSLPRTPDVVGDVTKPRNDKERRLLALQPAA